MLGAISLLSLPPPAAAQSFLTFAAFRTTYPPLFLAPEPTPNNPTPSSSSCSLHCPHFQSCSGCSHEYQLHHPPILDEAIKFFNGIGVPDFTFHSCRSWGWRCRAKLAVRGSSLEPLIGLYEQGTHNVVDIPECKAHHPNINAAVDLLKRGIAELNIEPYDEDTGVGDLRYVQMGVTTYNTTLPTSERYKNGKVQVALVWNSRNESSPNFGKLNNLANYLWIKGGSKNEVHLIHSVWANFQTSSNNIIFGNRWRHVLGERDFWEHVGGIDIYMAPSSFGQANTQAFDSLLHKVQKYVPYGASVVDLYAGAGVIGLSLAATRKCRSVKCVEVNGEAKFSFEKTMARLASALHGNVSWHQADTSKEPLSWLVGSEVVVVDPPRKGLDPSLLVALQSFSLVKTNDSSAASPKRKVKNEKRPWILREREALRNSCNPMLEEENRSLPHTLVYISCGWKSFKEDCTSLLSSKAWHLDKAHGFNFFPGTQSIEILAVFKRGLKVKRKKFGKTARPTGGPQSK